MFVGHLPGPGVEQCMSKEWPLLAWSLQSSRKHVQDPPTQYQSPSPLGQDHKLCHSHKPCRWSLPEAAGPVAQQRALVPHNGDSWTQLQPIVTVWGCGLSTCQTFRYFQSSCKSRVLHKIFQLLSADTQFIAFKNSLRAKCDPRATRLQLHILQAQFHLSNSLTYSTYPSAHPHLCDLCHRSHIQHNYFNFGICLKLCPCLVHLPAFCAWSRSWPIASS